VVPLCVRDEETLRVEGEGETVEYAVKMRRLPDEATLEALLARGELEGDALERLGRRVAGFHADAAAGPRIARFGRWEVVARNARENLEQSREQVGVTLSDPAQPDNPMVYVNDRFVEMTGYDREESIGVNCRFLQGPDTDEEPVAELRRAVEAEEPTSVELLNYRKDGTEFWNRVSIAPIRDADGRVTEWVGFQENITAFKERETALERQNERLDAFASIVSHDLRNPLNVAQGRVDLARTAADDEDEHLAAAAGALDRIESIVEHTLTLAREGETVGDPEPVSVADVAADSWETVDTAAAEFAVETDREALADADRLRNLFENLIRNAVEHGGPDVAIRVSDLDDGFYVADDGPGIPEGVADDLFDPGQGGVEGNTGFGLAIVHEIATAHGWTVAATESAEGGARFEIRGVERRQPPVPES
jgi:PAS domain S-box-containing protein